MTYSTESAQFLSAIVIFKIYIYCLEKKKTLLKRNFQIYHAHKKKEHTDQSARSN